MGAFTWMLLGLGFGGILFLKRETKKVIFFGGIILTAVGVSKFIQSSIYNPQGREVNQTL